MKSYSHAQRRRQAIQKALSEVEPSRRANVAKKADNTTLSHRAGYLKAAAGKASPRQAIKSHCLECCGWERGEVRDCLGLACSFYACRPFQEASG